MAIESSLQAASLEPTPEQKAKVQPAVLVEIMEGVTFSALLILFGFLYITVMPVFMT